MNNFNEEYKRTLDNIGGVQGAFEASEYASRIQGSIDEAINQLQREASNRANVSDDYLKGWLAEQWHAETLKINGAVRGKNDIWANVPGNNKTGEDIHYGNSSISKVAELKYYKTPQDTAKAISKPEYEGNIKIVPEDQKSGVVEAAEKLANKVKSYRPEQSKQYQDTADRANDRLEIDDVSSKPLAEKHAKEMAKDFKKDGDINPNKYDLNSESFVKWSDIARESGEAALHAAALSAALSAAPHIWAILKEYIETEGIDRNSLADRGLSVLKSAGTAGFRGGVAACLTATCKTGLMGEALKGISPAAIGMATTMTLNVIDYSIKLHQGKLTKQEFAHHCIRDTFVLSCGMGGAAIGQIIIPIPVLGALVGNIVGSMIGAVIFDGVNNIILGICAESGWTFFGMVKQDYVVPEEILVQAGYEIFSTHSFPIQSFSTSSFNVQSFTVNTLSFTPLRRGVISCKTIGYI